METLFVFFLRICLLYFLCIVALPVALLSMLLEFGCLF